ncbi:MAG: amidohydrolase [Ferroplasma sp.]|uniref:M20 metallopeptidase family protein n=1 Tax=Ferroplasma sp. TaxID=2591003 RepID=UPI0028157ACE|nr:amidohydrolase [Ferroplasma sp.]WMT51690.1 MAG: amidohydrolase [Ferroplasma sp.]
MGSEIEDYTVKIRRYIHAHPELSFKEEKTSEFIVTELKKMGLKPVRIAGTGVYADVLGEGKGKTVAVRADIDALPVQEANKLEYKSLNKGVMHACGHDAHTAMVLGLAKKLTSQKIKFGGTIRVFFQPAEENPPGGAIKMIEDGLLNNVDYVIGQHVDSRLQSGFVGYRAGPVSANSDTFYIKIKGKGGHGSMPERGIDAIYVAAQFVVMLQSIISRILSQTSASTITVGTFNGGYRHNVLADRVDLSGTVRTISDEERDKAKRSIENIMNGLKAAYGIDYEYIYEYGYPVMINDSYVTSILKEEAENLIGKDHVIEVNQALGGEDFGYYLQHRKGTFYRLGISNKEKGIIAPNHSPEFNIDEAALQMGVCLLLKVALRLTES